MPELTVRVGSRASRLAMWQTDHVIAQLEVVWPGLRCERVPMRTLGDRVTDVPLPRIGDRGLFTKEIEEGLRGATIDVAVHSLKDLPTESPSGLSIGAILVREDPRDALVAGRATLETLPRGARVGTSSIRRRAQLLAHRPDLTMVDIRGNVPTRLEKVTSGAYDATLLALAGLKRLGLAGAVSEILDTGVMLPAPGQGALGVQVRSDDGRVRELVARLDHLPTRLATVCERGLLAALEGGCQAPVGTATSWAGRTLHLQAVVASFDGQTLVRATGAATVDVEADAIALAARIAASLRERGAAEIIAACRASVGSAPVEPGAAS